MQVVNSLKIKIRASDPRNLESWNLISRNTILTKFMVQNKITPSQLPEILRINPEIFKEFEKATFTEVKAIAQEVEKYLTEETLSTEWENYLADMPEPLQGPFLQKIIYHLVRFKLNVSYFTETLKNKQEEVRSLLKQLETLLEKEDCYNLKDFTNLYNYFIHLMGTTKRKTGGTEKEKFHLLCRCEEICSKLSEREIQHKFRLGADICPVNHEHSTAEVKKRLGCQTKDHICLVCNENTKRLDCDGFVGRNALVSEIHKNFK
jgi:hypothetical protein